MILYHKKLTDTTSFIIKVKHTAGFTVTLPLYNSAGYNYNFTVTWGDGASGEVTSATDADRIHTYASGDNGGLPWVVTMHGTLEGWSGNTTGLKEYIVEVSQWGTTGFKSVNMSGYEKLVACYGKITTSQTSFANFFSTDLVMTTCEVGDWDMSNVTSLLGMFWGCSTLASLDVSTWDVSKVLTFSGGVGGWGALFGNCSSLTSLNLTNWQFNTTSNIVLHSMFYGCSKLTTIGDVSGWNTSKFYSCASMFQLCTVLNTLDCGGWDTSNVTDMSAMFNACNGFTTIDVASWDVTKVTSFSSMFNSSVNLTTLNLSAWVFNTTSNITFGGVFASCTKLTTVGDTSGWNTSKFTTLYSTFSNCQKLTSVVCTGWNTALVTNTQGLFFQCYKLTSVGDLSGWNTGNIVGMSGNLNNSWFSMFGRCSVLTSVGDLSGWNTAKVTNLESMFEACPLLTNVGDLSGWDTSKVLTVVNMFSGCVSMTTINCSNWNLSLCTLWTNMFSGCSNATTIDISGWTTFSASNVSLTGMFGGCYAVTSIDISGWASLKFTTLYRTFWECRALTSLSVNVLNISNCANLCGTFYNCYSLSALAISGWDVSKVINFGAQWDVGTFQNCTGLTSLDVSGWSLNTTSNITMWNMFQGCTGISTIDISGWDMTKLTNMTNFCYGCTSLASITLPNTLTIISEGAFYNCPALSGTLILPASISTAANSIGANAFSGSTVANRPSFTQCNSLNNTQPGAATTAFAFQNGGITAAIPLHVPTGSGSYTTAPWTTAAIFSSITKDL